MNINPAELGKRIAKRRRELGLKQCEVCEMAELSDKYLSNIERAISLPSLQVFMKLCEVLKTTPDALLLGTTPSASSSDIAVHLENKIKNMNENQISLILSFTDWVENQKL
ncbi:MAG: helix-turn-helix transcriptional regulator [Clostridia bacterium]|nr:helix-turn-helix transcriptional regulator [Clostridia bacterium]